MTNMENSQSCGDWARLRVAMTKEKELKIMETELDKTLALLKAEILRARAKHPSNRMLVEALSEEIGEAVDKPNAGIHGAAGATWYCAKMDQAGTDLSLFVTHAGRCHNTLCPNYSAALCIGNTEWLQVACVAIRLFEEGTLLTQSSLDLGDQLVTLGNRAHTILKAAGVPD